MSTIVTLSAKLELVGDTTYKASLERAATATKNLEKSIEQSSHAMQAFGNKSKEHMSVALRGADALAGKMKVLGTTSYASMAQATNGIGAFSSSLAALAGPMLATFSVTAVVAFGRSVVTAAAEAETSAMRLTAALRSQGTTSTKVRDDMLAFSEAMRLSTTFSDEAVTAAQTQLLMLTKLDQEGIQRATKAAIDYSAATGTDLVSSATKVAKAVEGNVMEWKRLGFVFTDVGDEAKTLNELIAQMEQSFGGQAAAELKTTAGAWKQLGESFGELKESLGGSSLPILGDLARGLREIIEVAKSDSALTRLAVAFATLGNSEVLRFFNALKADGGLLGDESNIVNTKNQIAQTKREIDDLLAKKSEATKAWAAGTDVEQGVWDLFAFDLAQLNKELAGQEAHLKKLEGGLDNMGGKVDLVTPKIRTLGDTLAYAAGAAGRLAGAAIALGTNPFGTGIVTGARGVVGVIENPLPQAPSLLNPNRGKFTDLIGGGEASAGMSMFGGAQAEVTPALEKARAERDLALRDQFLGGSGFAGSVASTALSAGPAAAGLQLLMASKGFQAALEPVNATLQEFADVIGGPLEAFAPLLREASEALSPLLQTFRAMTPLLSMMNQTFYATSFALRGIAEVANFVSDAFISMALGLLKTLKAILPDRLEPGWLDDSIKSLKKLRKSTDDVADAFDKFASILPEGYKLLNFRAYEYSPRVPASYYGLSQSSNSGGGSSGNGMSAQGSSASSGDVVIQIDGREIARASAVYRGREAIVRTGRAIYTTGA